MRLNTDTALMATMAATIEASSLRFARSGPTATWQPGEPLKLLFAGYAGSRNTGADVRVEEMIRQFRHLFGDDHLDLSILTIDPEKTRGYFPTVKQLHLPQVFPAFLMDTVQRSHGVVACEGSMFKSKFANALSTLMVGALGLAGVENKLAIGYGGEAGTMDPELEALLRRYASGASLMVRNTDSKAVLGRLGIGCAVGTDTAWTYEAPTEPGRRLLEEAGWDGETPVLALCPINPFWWPVKPDLARGVGRWLGGMFEKSHYSSIYFHNAGPEVDEAQDRYLTAIARAVRRSGRPVFPVCVGMEALDRGACEALSDKLGNAPVFCADTLDHPELVSLIRSVDALVSSRYHALVCSMPAEVPSAGITMDERIRNLMADRGTPELALEVDQPDLEDRLVETIEMLFTRTDLGIRETVDKNLHRMGEMGQWLVEEVRRRHPDFPIRPELGRHGDPADHLPRTRVLKQVA